MMVKADDNLKGRPWMFPSKRQEMGNPAARNNYHLGIVNIARIKLVMTWVMVS